MSRKSVVSMVFFFSLAVSLVRAQEIKVDIPFEKFVLANGLTVIVHEDHKVPIVAVNLWYHVGSKNEKRGKTGFAHLFEHLMFNGSEHYNQDYFKVLEKLGATDLNGTTNQDRTNYFQNVPTSALDTVLWMESDRMGHLLGVIDQARLDEQRGVVQNEKRQGENQPYGLVYNLTVENTFPAGHPYSWSVIGSMEDLNAASLDDVREWFKTYYGPSNATIVLAGDIDVKTAREKVERYFGAIPPGPPVPKHRAWVAKREGVKRQTLEDRVPQARVYKVWNTPEDYTEQSDLLYLAAQVLGSGRTSRLYKRLVHQDQIATDANAFQSASEIAGTFTIMSTARPGGDLTKVEKTIDEELARFLKEGPTADELARVRTRYVAGFLRGLERIGGFGGKSDVLARGQVFAGDAAAYKKRLERMQGATPEQVRSAAERWLSDGVYALEVHPFRTHKASGADVDRSKVPEPGPPPAFVPTKLQRGTLSNGLKLVASEQHGLPLVNFNLNVRAGYATDHLSGLQGTARLAMTMLDKGTKTRTSLEIPDQLERLGARLSAGSGLDDSTVFLSALKTNLDASLEIFGDVVLNPSFPDSDFQREQKQMMAAIQREKVEPFSMALRVLPAFVFGKGHPYGMSLTGSGTEATAGKITRDALVKFHRTWFKPNNATLIIVGDTTLAEIAPKLEKLFASWQPGDVPKLNVTTVEHQPKPLVYIIDRPGALQSTILAGHVAPPKLDRDDIAMSALNTSLGGAFVSRINMNLREDKHWSYGAGTVIFPTLGQRIFLTFAPVQTDKTKESLVELNKEFREILRERPPTQEELQRAQDQMTLRLPGRRETLSGVDDSIAEIVRYGLPDDHWETYPKKVRELTTRDLVTSAERLIHPGRLMWVVVGDRSKIETGVRELSLGELRLIDADGNLVND
ncbi:MAG: pitrilysin family protein [Bryobacteraceae bacterium]